jgi:hypothetical protein
MAPPVISALKIINVQGQISILSWIIPACIDDSSVPTRGSCCQLGDGALMDARTLGAIGECLLWCECVVLVVEVEDGSLDVSHVAETVA